MLRSFSKSIQKHFLLLLLIVVYFINGLLLIPQLSVNSDERDHLNYAIRLVKGHPEKIKPFDDASTMPISALNTIPRIIQQTLHPALIKKDGGVSDVIAGRYITLLISLFIGLYLYKWAFGLYGYKAGMFAFFLFVFCPNINAHAALVTTDAYSALFTLTTAYYFWKYITLRTWRSLFLFSVSIAMAQLAKQSLTHLYFIFIILAVIIYVKEHELFKNFRLKLLKLAAFLSINIVIINAGFLMNHTGLALENYQFRSAFFKTVQSSLKPIETVPLPLPKPYIAGLDLTKNIDEIGGGHPQSSGRIYILGQSKEGSGFWYYYFVTLFLKTPLTILLFTGIAGFYTLRQRFKKFSINEFIPFFTMVYMLIYFSCFYNSQVGIRHVLLLFPLWYLLLSPIIYKLLHKKIRFFFLLFVCYTLATFYYYAPNLISYTNEFVLPKRNAYKLLADSNLDYQQGYFWMQAYLKRHQDVHFPDTLPKAGKYIISVNDYLDLEHTNKFDWLRNFEPTGQDHHCNLIFDIAEKDLKSSKP